MTTATFCKHVSRCVGQVKPPWVPMASLGEACATGDVQSIAHLLDNGASVNEFIVSGYASESRLVKGGGGWSCVTQGWIPSGFCSFFHFAQPIEGGDGRTPLSFAARNGHLEAVRLLLYRGAAVNVGRVSCVGAGVIFGRIVLNPCVCPCDCFLCVGSSARYKSNPAARRQ